jgi:ribosomal protein S12 methylthiotransferase
MKLYLESLGCARNQVDSEIMIGRLKKAGWTITDDPGQADTIVVNTCSFIESAANESIDVILDLARYKHEGSCSRLIATGCLAERYREEIVKALPEVDIFLGTGAFDQIVKAVEGPKFTHECIFPDPDSVYPQDKDSPRNLTVPYMAYLRVAEGCSRQCSYCIIPRLRGKQRSRPVEDIVAEARRLIATGVKELVLVAQDTTFYGKDLQPPANLTRLMKRLARISERKGDNSEGPWFRVLYGHPESIEDSFITTVASHPNICSYFDIPIQHVSSSVLEQMGRRYTRDYLSKLFDRIRTTIPEAALRTTIIVGFPGETEKDFEELMHFIEQVRFDHLGTFIYSDSEDLPSHRLSGHVLPKVARERYHQLMSSQSGISSENNRKYVGKKVRVLLEERMEEHLFVGRTCFQAPEVDGVTYLNAGKMWLNLKIGSFADMKITDSLEYDLIGETL